MTFLTKMEDLFCTRLTRKKENQEESAVTKKREKALKKRRVRSCTLEKLDEH